MTKEPMSEPPTLILSNGLMRFFWQPSTQAQAILKEKFSGQRAMLLSLSAFLPPTSFCYIDHITEEHVGKFIDQFKLDVSVESLTAELRQFAELCTHNKPE